jgi:hypothetical protein
MPTDEDAVGDAGAVEDAVGDAGAVEDAVGDAGAGIAARGAVAHPDAASRKTTLFALVLMPLNHRIGVRHHVTRRFEQSLI